MILEQIKARAEEIKKTRMAAELLVYENHADKFLKFDIEEAVKNNEAKVKKELKINRIASGLLTAGYVGVIGAAAVTGGPALALGATLVGGMIGGFNIVQIAISEFATNVEIKNHEEIKAQLTELKNNVNKSVVNEKTTISDYFKGAKQALKEKYDNMIQDRINKSDAFTDYYTTVVKIVNQRDAMRNKVNGNNNDNPSFKKS
jgi:hypothetical protein